MVGYVVVLFIILWLLILIVFFVELILRDNCIKLNMELVWFWVEFIVFILFGINLWLYLMRSNVFRNEMKCVF